MKHQLMSKKISLVMILLLFFNSSYSSMIKRVHFDNAKRQPGYKNTIAEKGVQATNYIDDRILSVYKNNNLYCLGTTKLAATSSGYFSNCFDNENTLGNKVSSIYLDKKTSTPITCG